MTKKPKITRAAAFYFVEGFWADMKPDYSTFNSKNWLTPGFNKLMEEVVVSIKNGRHKIEIHRDGLISYFEPGLNKLPEPAKGETFQRIEKCIDFPYTKESLERLLK